MVNPQTGILRSAFQGTCRGIALEIVDTYTSKQQDTSACVLILPHIVIVTYSSNGFTTIVYTSIILHLHANVYHKLTRVIYMQLGE